MNLAKRILLGLALWMFLLAGLTVNAQNYTLRIEVVSNYGDLVSNATLTISKRNLLLDSTGRIQLALPPDDYNIQLSAINFYPKAFRLSLLSDTTVRVELQTRESLLGNVTVRNSYHVKRNQMSFQQLDINQIKKLPVLLGELDPLKTITLLPGIKSGGDAGAGIYVRGGGPDQNLVMLDGIPVYNPNHLLGFFSIFNGEAINSIDVIKGGIPAEYGGRLSSVIAVGTRSGSKDSIKMSGGIGLISSRLALEGPIIKDKLSFIVSARRTYIDQVGRLVARDRIGKNGYFFYDINAKLDYTIDKYNQLLFTFYTGKDDFSFIDDENGRSRHFNAIWGNKIAGLTWKQQISRKLRQETAVVYNKFDLDSRVQFRANGFVFASGLSDYQLKNDWYLVQKSWLKWKFGVQYISHNFVPGAGSSSAGVQEFKSKINDQYGREAAAYLSTDINITPELNVIAGLRYSYFNQVGPTEKVIYGPDGAPTGEVEKYGKGESIAQYHYPEPRLSAVYRLSKHSSVKLSYTRTVQYLHLATTSAATFPSDLWVPSSKKIRPGLAEQVAIGYFKELEQGAWELSVEAYYKTMSNQLEFKPGAQLLLNQHIEDEMIFGTGKAYGIEFFVQKKTGRLTGWIGYTLSRTERTFPAMNGGKPFPYRYDRTHDLSVVTNYRLSNKWEASAVFVYGTGNALTIPTGRYFYNVGYNTQDGQPIFTNIDQYGAINDYRMPAYHRMDIAFTFTPKPNSTKRFKSSWQFSLYNLYNRYNPYFIYMDIDDQTIQAKQVFLFPVMPGITWNFHL